MQFTFGRTESGSIVVERRWPIRDQQGAKIGVTPHLEVEFRNYFWDSESDKAKKMYRQYVEAQAQAGEKTTVEKAQERVEQFLLNHPDYGKVGGKGISRIDEKPVVQEAPIESCLHMDFNDEGVGVLCGEAVLNGKQHCRKHAPDKVEATATSG